MTTDLTAYHAFMRTLAELARIEPDPSLPAAPEPAQAAPAPAPEAEEEPPPEPECFECGGPPHRAWWVYDAAGVQHDACEHCATWCPVCQGERVEDVGELYGEPYATVCPACDGRGSRAAYEARQERRGVA